MVLVARGVVVVKERAVVVVAWWWTGRREKEVVSGRKGVSGGIVAVIRRGYERGIDWICQVRVSSPRGQRVTAR